MKPREHFGGRAAVIMALAGSAIGLGNIWRFPYMVGENGGAAFILVYILATLLLLLPMFLHRAQSLQGAPARHPPPLHSLGFHGNG
jgi:NSS family neurotransmitter:Na+ symporter